MTTANLNHHRQRIVLPSRDHMLAAVNARDAAWDGRFFYAVLTTSVYCRPSCASRPARPENLRFFADAAAATAAGFRACRRCRPDELKGETQALAESARYIGMTPAVYRKGGAGETICYAYRRSALGPLLLTATEQGVCFAQFADGKAALIGQLRGHGDLGGYRWSIDRKRALLDIERRRAWRGD